MLNAFQLKTSDNNVVSIYGLSRREAWSKLGDMSKIQAMSEYIDEVTNHDFEWEDKVI